MPINLRGESQEYIPCPSARLRAFDTIYFCPVAKLIAVLVRALRFFVVQMQDRYIQ